MFFIYYVIIKFIISVLKCFLIIICQIKLKLTYLILASFRFLNFCSVKNDKIFKFIENFTKLNIKLKQFLKYIKVSEF